MTDTNHQGSAGHCDGLSEGDEQMLSLTEIYYQLLADLKDVSEEVEAARCHANENQPRQSWGSCISAAKSTLHANDLQCLYKKNAMEALAKTTDVKLFGEPLHSAHAHLELRAKMIERVQKDREHIDEMCSQLTSLQKARKDIVRITEELKKIESHRSISGEMKTIIKWQEVAGKVKLQRAKLVKDIRYVSDEVCPNSDIPDILTDALKQSSNGNDPYIHVEDNLSADVEFLLRCNIIVRHPHDRKLVRLRELV